MLIRLDFYHPFVAPFLPSALFEMIYQTQVTVSYHKYKHIEVTASKILRCRPASMCVFLTLVIRNCGKNSLSGGWGEGVRRFSDKDEGASHPRGVRACSPTNPN